MIPNTATRKYWTRHQYGEGERTRNCLCIHARAFSGLGVIFLQSPQQDAAHSHVCEVLLQTNFLTAEYKHVVIVWSPPKLVHQTKGKHGLLCVSNLLVPYSPTTFLHSYPSSVLAPMVQKSFWQTEFLFFSMQRHSKATWKWAKKGGVYLDLTQGCCYH